MARIDCTNAKYINFDLHVIYSTSDTMKGELDLVYVGFMWLEALWSLSPVRAGRRAFSCLHVPT